MKSVVVAVMMVMSVVSNAKAESNDVIIQVGQAFEWVKSSIFDFKSGKRADEKDVSEGQLKVFVNGNKENIFTPNVYAGGYGHIYDLGEKSCKDLKTYSNEDNRKTNGIEWLAYSEADPSRLKPSVEAKVYSGHCYLIYQNQLDRRTVALFNVISNDSGKAVIIGNIEVLDKR